MRFKLIFILLPWGIRNMLHISMIYFGSVQREMPWENRITQTNGRTKIAILKNCHPFCTGKISVEVS